MSLGFFTEKDLEQIKLHGLSLGQVEEQIDFFSGTPPAVRLVRPCTAGDGIICLEESSKIQFLQLYEREGDSISRGKFVPASGAATRMFKALLSERSAGRDITRDLVLAGVKAKREGAADLLAFIDGIRDFAFYKDLSAVLHSQGLDIEILLEKGRFNGIVNALLSPEGLNYAELPKGLLAFHYYPEGARTSFEEHLVEASHYLADPAGRCYLAMTVSPEHFERFNALFQKVRANYEHRLKVTYYLDFSVQRSSTDTIAVELDNVPFRLDDGSLLFRPGGHGALLDNLNEMDCDVVFITNIDNVVPDQCRQEIVKWKKILGGYLLYIRDRVFMFLNALSVNNPEEDLLSDAESFAGGVLNLPIPLSSRNLSSHERAFRLKGMLNRPIRVCGMVKNQGEPGGGPFWVKDDSGATRLQIVEKAQINLDNREQREILAASTHFNPVDLVCSLRNFRGEKFDLREYRDPKAVFISRKSHNGRDLKALELPGLWNGAMAWWITLFLEVPPDTFNPVKTVTDLLRPAHKSGHKTINRPG
ncbi:MAG: DUF4301 family protein [Desulfobacteraceae bacterium]|nr:MAG: DUF4301 family protein [Desulfobacteraceae bacterium]